MASAHDFAFDRIEGGELPLSEFDGKAVLVVNTASKCGLTPQYAGLEELWNAYRAKGLVVLGVPCNQFAGQEPGTEAEIQDFCATRYQVDFPMTAKVEVKDAGRHPFYAWAEQELGEGAVPVWNFHKILIGKDGAALAAFGPRTAPCDQQILDAVDKAL
jgi:glutathione peroxidase